MLSDRTSDSPWEKSGLKAGGKIQGSLAQGSPRAQASSPAGLGLEATPLLTEAERWLEPAMGKVLWRES